MKTTLLTAGLLLTGLMQARSAIIISEIHPSGSGNATYGADFFELTNTGVAAVNITGWRVDDGSASFGSSAVLNGIASIPAGQSVIFLETSTPATTFASFLTAWFGANPPAGLQIGSYSGGGLGLSTGGDGVNIFNGGGASQASVSFGASTSGVTFDNAAGLTGAVSQVSSPGVNGAFVSPAGETGSPGRIAPIPEPSIAASLVLGLGVALGRRRRA